MELNKTFIDGLWSKEINVTSFVQTNITPYLGDASFLQGPTERTKHIWNLCLKDSKRSAPTTASARWTTPPSRPLPRTRRVISTGNRS